MLHGKAGAHDKSAECYAKASAIKAKHPTTTTPAATSDAALPVEYVVVSGPGSIQGDVLTALDPGVSVEAVCERATVDTLPSLLEGADLVLDGCDDFATRFAVNTAAIAAGIPLVSGAVGRWEGQVAVFTPHLKPDAPCYQCWVPETPPDAEDCAVMGVVGALTGVIGSMMAMEAIKLITGAGEPLIGRMCLYDGLSGRSRTVTLPASRSCPACASDRTGTLRSPLA